MPCALTTNITYDSCKDNISGIKRILFTEYANLDQTNVAKFALTANVVTTLVLATSKLFRAYNLDRQMAEASDNATGNVETKINIYAPTITFTINGFTTVQRTELDLLMKNYLIAIIERKNGTYWIAGLDGGLDVTEIQTAFGKNFEDFSGNIVSLVGKSATRMLEVDSSLIAAQLVAAP